MFKNVKDILISGGCYGEGTTLNDIMSQRLNIVYGRNGSGKSSLAKAIFDYAQGTADGRFSLEFAPQLDDGAKERMFVFGEDFVINNVKLRKEGLEEIVMIGEQVDLSNREDELKAALQTTEQELENFKSNLETKQNEKARTEKDLIDAIKDGYASRERDFRGLTNKPKVNLDTVVAIYNRMSESAAQDIVALSKEIAEGTTRLRGATNAQKVEWHAPSTVVPNILAKASSLLEKKVEQVELDDRDRRLVAILSDASLSHYVDDAKRDLIDVNASVCPLCQQSLTSGTLEDLEAQIKRVLNKDVEEYKSELRRTIESIRDIVCPPPSFVGDAYNDDIRAYEDVVAKINKALGEVRNRLEAKTKNLFNGESALDLGPLGQLYERLAQVSDKLNGNVTEFNHNIDARKELEDELKEKNQILAYLENQLLFGLYYGAVDAINKTQEHLNDAQKELADISRELNDLASRRCQTKIAIDFINRCISSIFFDRDRLVLEQAQGKFVLKSRGRAVAPDSVSTGERNIIGLAYFFATLYKETTEADRYSRPYLVVLDDPVTSFDQDNRLGVMTFLKEQLTELLVNGDDNKVLVLSHDQRTIDQFVGINSSVENAIKSKNWKHQGGHDDYYVYELHRRARRKTNEKTKSEYSQMLNLLYCFALDEDPEKMEYVGVGNTIRRVLETFSLMTFNTADYVRMVGNTHLRLSPPVRCDMVKVKAVYEKMLTRIILNPESHSSTLIDQDSYESTFTRDSLQKLAQYALTFIMCVNEQHLWSSLGKDWKTTVTSWFEQLVIGNNMAVYRTSAL